MELVADTNIIAAAIVKDGLTRKLVCRPELDLYSPSYILDELERNKPVFMAKSGLDAVSYEDAYHRVMSNIEQAPLDSYLPFKKQSEAVSPDWKDWPFFAVALQRNCPLWSNEKHLKEQDKVKVYNTAEMLAILGVDSSVP